MVRCPHPYGPEDEARVLTQDTREKQVRQSTHLETKRWFIRCMSPSGFVDRCEWAVPFESWPPLVRRDIDCRQPPFQRFSIPWNYVSTGSRRSVGRDRWLIDRRSPSCP